jgi:hypothetical protein
MNESMISVDLAEEEILIYKVSDEALEAAACGMKDKAGVLSTACVPQHANNESNSLITRGRCPSQSRMQV